LIAATSRLIQRLKLACAQTVALGDIGRPEQAAAIAEEATTLAEASHETAFFQAIILVVYHTEALIIGGCLAEAMIVAERTRQRCAGVPGIAQAFAAAVSGMAALANGHLLTATQYLRQAFTEFSARTDGGSYHFGISYAEALARTGDLDAAGEVLAQVQQTRHPAHAFRESDDRLVAGWLAAARGRTSQAQAQAHEAAEFARTHGQHGREVLCLQAAIQFGDRHSADRLTELAELVEGPRAGLVTRWAAALADQLITSCGATTPATQAAAMRLPLTDREREIATLISQGLSNCDIAETLTLSVRTIEGHVYRACARVGAANRAELAQLIIQFAPPHVLRRH
jgi:DNA-binding NarL/FixJ family response regulator